MIQLYTDDQTIASRLDEIGIKYLFMRETVPLEDAILLCRPDALETLRESCGDAKVLVLSQRPDFSEGVRLLQKGVKGYGNLYMQKVHLLQAISTIDSGAVWLYPELMQELILLGSKATLSEEKLSRLSKREQEVAREIEKGASNKEIAIALGITERTVKAHLSSIFEKLGVTDRLALAMLLRQ